jgi:hypothetical protein
MVIDGVLMILRRPTFMRKLINKAHVAIETLKFFTLNQWSWTNANLNKLQSALVNTDDNESLESFSFDISSLDWKIFNDNYVLGVRHYVLKNHPDSMDSSRKKLKILYFLHRFIQLAFVFFLIYNIMNVFSTAIPRNMLPLDMLTPQIRHYELWQKISRYANFSDLSTPSYAVFDFVKNFPDMLF